MPMRSIRTRCLPALLALLALAAPVPVRAGMKVDSLYDKQADFSSYRTYRWEATAIDDTPTAQLLDRRIRETADALLADKGMERVEAGEEADLLLTYHGVIENNLVMEGVRYELAPHVVWTGADPLAVTRRYEVGTLVLDFADATSEKIVWSGIVKASAKTQSQLRDKVEKAVTKALKHYPPD